MGEIKSHAISIIVVQFCTHTKYELISFAKEKEGIRIDLEAEHRAGNLDGSEDYCNFWAVDGIVNSVEFPLQII